MRVKFTREKIITPEFNGNTALPPEEQLRYKLKPMSLGDFTDTFEQVRRIGVANKEMIEAVKEGKVEVETDVAKLGVEEQKKFLLLAAEVLPKYVESVGAPLLAAEGDEPISVQEMANLAPFMTLVGELLWGLIHLSQPTEIDIKN